MKKIKFLGRSLDDIKNFPESAKRQAGHQLSEVQKGLEPADWKPMGSIGVGVKEIRIKEESGQYRVIYVAKFEGRIYVLHAFQKKTQRTPKKDLDLALSRLKTIQ